MVEKKGSREVAYGGRRWPPALLICNVERWPLGRRLNDEERLQREIVVVATITTLTISKGIKSK